jgi:hypothetical protein
MGCIGILWRLGWYSGWISEIEYGLWARAQGLGLVVWSIV